jgi:hypothetical protein
MSLLANCEILTEGYDDRNIECIIMARPTQSQPLYIQIIGRGLRLPEGISNLRTATTRRLLDAATKTECTIIDVVGNCTRHDLEMVTALSLFGESVGAAASPEGVVAPRPRVTPDGHAPATEVFEAVKPLIREIDLFAQRTRSAQLGIRRPVIQPQQVPEGPLANWTVFGGWEEGYKRELHRKIVVNWEPVPNEAPCSLKRSKNPEYEAAISSCAPGRWTLSVKATNGMRYSRTFGNLFDAFGCAEDFVFQGTWEIDRLIDCAS